MRSLGRKVVPDATDDFVGRTDDPSQKLTRKRYLTPSIYLQSGATEMTLPKLVRKELDGYLECGLLRRGFARLRCTGRCNETSLVAFSCKGRGLYPSCLGRKTCATAAHLIDDVMPLAVPLRQLGADRFLRVAQAVGVRLGSALTRVFTKVVSRF